MSAHLDNDCTVVVALEKNKVSPSTFQIDVSLQSIVPLPRREQRGNKRKGTSKKSDTMTSSPIKNLLEEKQKEKVELEEAETNRALSKIKMGVKIKKEKLWKTTAKFSVCVLLASRPAYS